MAGALLAAGAFRGLVAALPLGAWGESATLDWTSSRPRWPWRSSPPQWSRSRRASQCGAVTSVGRSGARARVALLDAAAGSKARWSSPKSRSPCHGGRRGPAHPQRHETLRDRPRRRYTSDVGVIDIALPNGLQPHASVRRGRSDGRVARDARSHRCGRHAEAADFAAAGGARASPCEGVTQTEVTTTFIRLVTPGYLETMGVKLRDGRCSPRRTGRPR